MWHLSSYFLTCLFLVFWILYIRDFQMIDDYGDGEFNCDNASTELFDQSLSRVINSDHDESVTLRVMMMTTTMMLTTTTMMLTTTMMMTTTMLMTTTMMMMMTGSRCVG